MSQAVVDSHLHVWNPDGVHYPWLAGQHTPLARPYLLPDVEPDLDAHGVRHAVLVQTADNRADCELLLFQALSSPRVAGVVAWAPLTSPDATAAQLDAWRREPVVGLTHRAQHEPAGWLLRPDVHESLRVLAARGLTLDVPAHTPALLRDVVELADRHPDLTIVVGHLGMPPLASLRAGDRRDWEQWSALIGAAASAPRVVAKLTGLPQAAGRGWNADHLRPAVDRALAVFGPDRLMAGSGWPAAAPHAGTYAQAWSASLGALDRATGGSGTDLGEDDRRQVTGGTASRVYGLLPVRAAA